MKEGQEQDQYTDNSGDKKYYTMVPNIVVHNSTAFEQSLYLVMKRFAGEHGSCFASPQTLANLMDTSVNTVKKYREKLIAKGWIRKEGKKKSGKTGQFVDEYSIVDLWQLNMEYFNKVSNDDTFSSKVSTGDTKVSTADGKVSAVAYEEDLGKKIYEEERPPKKISETERIQTKEVINQVRRNLQEQGILSK